MFELASLIFTFCSSEDDVNQLKKHYNLIIHNGLNIVHNILSSDDFGMLKVKPKPGEM